MSQDLVADFGRSSPLAASGGICARGARFRPLPWGRKQPFYSMSIEQVYPAAECRVRQGDVFAPWRARGPNSIGSPHGVVLVLIGPVQTRAILPCWRVVTLVIRPFGETAWAASGCCHVNNIQ